jgi:hypothetical protein
MKWQVDERARWQNDLAPTPESCCEREKKQQELFHLLKFGISKGERKFLPTLKLEQVS